MMVTCAGCERPILDRFLFNVLDRAWHAKCVQCSDCSAPLTEKCFSREGKLYCREDFFRRFGTKCAGCLEGISPNDLVRRARNQVFHLKCFTCMICRKQLSTGEELYILDENKFICKDDYLNRKYEGTSDGEENMDNDTEHTELEKLDPCLSDKEDTMDSGEGTVPTPLPLTDSKDDLNRSLDSPLSNPPPLAAQDHAQNCPSVPGANSTGSANASEEAPSPLADDDLVSDSLEKDGIDSKAINNNNNGDGANRENQDAPAGTKKRGPRTTIKAKQLETLKAAFAATPKPTRHIREQLAKETGLNMRVIQVWFQNRRSKERRMKQLSALGARRHFFRNPRRMRMDGLSPADLDDNPDMLGQQGFSYPFPDGAPGDLIPGYQGYGDFFPPGQPGEPGMNFVPTSSGPQGAPGLLDQHQGPLGANGQFLPPNDFATSEPHIPPLQPPQDGLFPQGPPPTSLPSGFGQALGHQQREMTAETW